MDSPGQKKTRRNDHAIRGWLSRWMMILAVGGFLCLVYPITFPSWLAQSNLEIFTTAWQNPSASGAELRLLSMTRSDGKAIDLSSLKSSNLWKIDRGQRFAANKKASSKLSLEEDSAYGYRLKFLGGPNAGIVQVAWRGQLHRLDLYHPMEEVIEFSLPTDRRLRTLQILYAICVALVIGLGLFALTRFLVSHRWQKPEPIRTPSRWVILGYALPSIGVWSIYLLAFWPGIMSYDSLLQWREMSTWKYTEISPAFHTFANWLLTRLWPSPAAIALFQILSLSLVIGWALYLFRRAVAPKWACGLSAVLIAISPVCAATTITLWKDNPYTTALLVFSLLLFQLAITKGKWLQKNGVWMALGLSGALAALFRHNGLPGVVTSFAVLLLLYPKSRRYTIYSMLVFLSFFALVRGPLYHQLAVDQSFREWQYGIRLLHYLAAYSQFPRELSPEQLSMFQSLWPPGAPLPYDCYFTDTTHFNIPPREIIEHIPVMEETLYQLFKENPRISLDHWLCANDLVWHISEPNNGYLSTYDFSNYWDRTTYSVGAGVTPIPIQSKLPGLKPILTDFLFVTNTWFIWRPALYLYLALYFGLVFALRQCRPPQSCHRRPTSFLESSSETKQSAAPIQHSQPPLQNHSPRRCRLISLSFYTPLIVHSLVLLGINASQEARFQFIAYLMCLLSIALVFIPHGSPIPTSPSNGSITYEPHFSTRRTS